MKDDGLCRQCGKLPPVCPRCEGTGEVDDDPHGTGHCVAEPCDECGGDPEALDDGLCSKCRDGESDD